jgi:predicted transcriptional regulator
MSTGCTNTTSLVVSLLCAILSALTTTKGNQMTVEELEKHASLYRVAKILGMTAPSVYKWKKSGIPPLRLYQLKEKRPEWFIKTKE